jgi:hypothetical protein
MSYARDRICEIARKYAGTGASHEPDKYKELLAGDVETPAMAAAMLKMSTCGLFARGVWRQAGVDAAVLNRSYVPGRAVSDLFVVAYSKDAWVKASTDKAPKPGDVFIIYNADSGADAHVGIVVTANAPNADGSLVLGTCEGGQGNYGADSGAFIRSWVVKNGAFFMGTRRVRGWVDADKLEIEEPPVKTDVELPVETNTAVKSTLPKGTLPALAAIVSAVLAILATLHHC